MSVITFSTTLIGQQLQNKYRMPILPEAGDYAIGANAVPILNYVGNIFNGTQENEYAGENKFVNFFSGQSLYGKYFLDSNKAVRINFLAQGSSFNNTHLVFDDASTSPDDMVEDKFSSSFQTFRLGGGLEWRKGKGRLQGYYGGEIGLGFSTGTKRTYEYGNDFSAANQSPNSTSWTNNGTAVVESSLASRVVETNGANTFTFGLRPFAGVEYFFAPKISLGMEFGWALDYSVSGESESVVESFNTVSNTVEETIDNLSSGSNQITFGTDNFNGSLNLMFHF